MSKEDDDDINFDDDCKYSEEKEKYRDEKAVDYPIVDVSSIFVNPVHSGISEPFELKIGFSLDRDVVAAYWQIKVL